MFTNCFRFIAIALLFVATGTAYAQALDARMTHLSVEPIMQAGVQYPVSITMKNTGTQTWVRWSYFRLGSWYGNANWSNIQRVEFPLGVDTVAPGQSVTFNFTVTAPAQPGSYGFNWRMVQDLVAWFGDTVSAWGPIDVTYTGLAKVLGAKTVYPRQYNSSSCPRTLGRATDGGVVRALYSDNTNENVCMYVAQQAIPQANGSALCTAASISFGETRTGYWLVPPLPAGYGYRPNAFITDPITGERLCVWAYAWGDEGGLPGTWRLSLDAREITRDLSACVKTRTQVFASTSAAFQDTFLTIDPSQNQAALSLGYVTAGSPFEVETAQNPFNRAFKRYYGAAPYIDHFYTHLADEQSFVTSPSIGYQYERDEGYVYPIQMPGTVPLYRFSKYQPWNGDVMHYYSKTNAAPSGFGLDGQKGYVCQ